MDHFSQQSIDGYKKKLAALKEHNHSDFEDRKAAMLKELNLNLFKNVVNKEKTNVHRTLSSWREGPEKNEAEKNARIKFVEFSE